MTTEHEIFGAIRAGDADRVVALLAASPSLAEARNERGHSPVLIAQYRHQHAIVQLLLDAGPVLDIWDAASVGRTDRVGALLDEDAGLLSAYSSDGFYPLGLAAYFGHLETARLLVDRGAPVDQAARNPMRIQPLHAAAAGGYVDIARLLVERGAPVDASQQGGWTPLQAAARRGDVALAQLLLEHGADPKLQNEAGKSAIGVAAEEGQVEVLKLLKRT
jgi:ankyrin repeat protein